MVERLFNWEKLEKIPVPILFFLLIVTLAYVGINPIGFPIPISTWGKESFAQIEKLQPGDIILVDYSVGASMIPEFEPLWVAFFKYTMEKDLRVVYMSTSAEGPFTWQLAIEKAKPEAIGAVYGKDYVMLGYISGLESAFAAILDDVFVAYNFDHYGTPLDQLEIMQDLHTPTYTNIKLIIAACSNLDAATGWVRQGAVRYGIPLVLHMKLVDVPVVTPYYPVNVKGIFNGGLGSSEFEVLSGYPGDAVALSDMASVGGGIVLIFIILGNIGWIMKPKKKS